MLDFLLLMAGCFDVSYRYVESATHPLQDLALRERIVFEAEGDSGAKLQHWFLEGGAWRKHWREEWRAVGGGAWEQRVFGPDESLRYACTARFTQNQWRCAVPSAPKPRRDRDRDDYLLLDRDSTLQILPNGFVQMEHNAKRDAEGTLIATEIGWNEYFKLDDAPCSSFHGGG